MSRPLFVKKNNEQKSVNEAYVKKDGMYKRAILIYTKKDGQWLHKHEYDTLSSTVGTCLTPSSTEYGCPCGNCYTQEGSKNFNNHVGVVVENGRTSSTCLTQGTVYYVYNGCGHSAGTGTLELDPNNHEGSVVEDSRINSTCLTQGTVSYKYSGCGHFAYSEALPVTGHTESAWIVDTEATCTEAGSRHKECTVCDTTIVTEPIPVLGHSWSGLYLDSPSCTQAGREYRICQVCSAEEVIRTIPPEHTHERVEVGRTPSTCTTPGAIHYKWSCCGATEDEPLPLDSDAHNWELHELAAPGCTTDGYEIYKCTYCGEEQFSALPAGHYNTTYIDYGNGFHANVCNDCGEQLNYHAMGQDTTGNCPYCK